MEVVCMILTGAIKEMKCGHLVRTLKDTICPMESFVEK